MTFLLLAASAVYVFIETAGVGHTVPAAAHPFGMLQPGPDTCAAADAFKGVWAHCGGNRGIFSVEADDFAFVAECEAVRRDDYIVVTLDDGTVIVTSSDGTASEMRSESPLVKSGGIML